MRDKENGPEDGFTLVEIIASIVLLGLVISVFMAIFPQMINWSNSAEKELVSSNLTARVAHEIYEGKYAGLKETYELLNSDENKKKNIDCSVGLSNYTPVKVTEEDSKHLEIYTVSFKACLDSDKTTEKTDSLMRVHFTITNEQTNHSIDSFAFYKGAEAVN